MVKMTTGNIPRHLVSYAVPLVLGNVFQLTYNAVDSIVLGRFAGTVPLAAVGVASPVMNIVIFVLVGLCMGASILMSGFFGAEDYGTLKRQISTALFPGLAFTAVLSAVGIAFVRPLLHLIRTPPELLDTAASYLRIVFGSLAFTFLYNLFASALRSVGDSRTPIVCVVISAVLNGVLDFVFVARCDWGANGAAWATAGAQVVSAVLCVGYVYARQPLLRILARDVVVDAALLKKTVQFSWVSAMQQTCLYVGKLFVQGAVNPLGVGTIAAYNAVTRVDDFAFSPQQSISHSLTTFLAQNRGAEKTERLRSGIRAGMLIETAYWVGIGTAVFFGAEPIMRLFVGAQSAVVLSGSSYLRAMAFFYLLPAWTNGLQGIFRGMGDVRVTLVSTLLQMGARVAFVYVLAPRFGIQGIAYACALGWVVMIAYEFPMYVKRIRGRLGRAGDFGKA